MNSKYDDIIRLPHHRSPTRPPMSMHDRAAQFSPFAALVGHDEMIEESARYTDRRIEPEESVKEEIDRVLRYYSEHPGSQFFARAVYFVKDSYKQGGSYLSNQGEIKKIDHYNRRLIFENGVSVPIDDILALEEIEL